MLHLNDARFDYYGLLGFTGSLMDREIAWLKAQPGVSATLDHISDLWLDYLEVTTGDTGHRNDLMQTWLNDLGYTGHINDMWLQFLSSDILANGLNPLVTLDHTSILDTAGDVTSWDNVANGAGATAYDLSVMTGTPTVELQQGKRVVRFDAASNLKPVSQQSIAQPHTVLMIAKSDTTTGSGNLIDGRNSTASLRCIRTATNLWRAQAGQFLDVTATDTDINYHSILSDGATSIYSVINTVEGTQLGMIGTNPFLYMTMGSTPLAAQFFDGWIGGLWVYDRVLTTSELALAQQAALALWSVGTNA